MKKFILFSLLTSIFLLSCSSPQIKFTEELGRKLRDETKNIVLKQFKAEDSIFSLIYFTSVFKDDIVKVENDDKTIFNDTIKSDPSLGLAKVIRVDNTTDIKITDVSLDYSFKLKKKNNRKYKYIYIKRKRYEGNKYVITYSNTMRAFY